MTTSLTTSLNDLREALLALKPTGAKGFEGLLANVLSKIAGQDFRLAKSGLQLGKDGETLASTNHISFEGKLFAGDIPAKEVHGKITQIIGSGAPPDIWVLGATVEAGTQLLEPMQAAAEKNGIVVLVLDWPESSAIPPLAVACAMAPNETCAFFQAHIADAQLVANADAALAAIAATTEFNASAETIGKALADPTACPAIARSANRRWLEAAFSDKRIAKGVFGQALAPKADAALGLRPRPGLVDTVQKHIAAPPPGTVIALIGGDGYGKSWLFAQSWLALKETPLTIVIPATTIKTVDAYSSILPALITRLIQQTDASDTKEARARWERRFRYWKEQPNEATPRFVVCVDGLNEQSGVNWSQWVDGAAATIEQHGGALIVTVRSSFYDERLRTALHSKVALVRVPEWTQGELKTILTEEGVDTAKIKPNVLSRLRNPRILGIAFELKDSVQIQDFAELTVERLLFEHIRIGERHGNAPEPAGGFVKRLSEHAQEILNRINAQKADLLFDRARENDNGYALNAELLAVAGENFFKPLPEDPTLYTLSDDGLTLALGLAIIRALKKAAHGSREISDVLDGLIEPVAALDKTADAIFAALLVSSADEQCPPTIRQALISAFLRLQNIDSTNFNPFVSAVRKMPDEALYSLYNISLKEIYASHKDWLQAALRRCRTSPECWKVMAGHISRWLRSYSLDPNIGVISTRAHEGADKVAEELARRTKELETRLADMPPAERAFLAGNMIQGDAHDPSALTDEALTLLAGMELAPFVTDLVACAYSIQLNSSFRAPYDDYVALLRFNRKDWNATRVAMRQASSFLFDKTASRTGKWALISILRGMATDEDSALEHQLVEELTRDRDYPKGWRLVERYCASDPCDPSSLPPDSIDSTATRYREINVNEIASQRWTGSDDHFVRDARPGLARFVPQAAIDTQRAIAKSIASRDVDNLMLGVTSLEEHSAVIGPETVTKLLEVARSLSSPREPGETREARDNYISAQYALQAAFPHLDGNVQLDVLISLPPHGPPLIKLAEIVKQADPDKLEQALEHALSSDDYSRQLAALLFARNSGTALTERSRAIVAELAKNARTSVRAEALSVIAHLKSPELIEPIVASGWKAATLDRRENHFEAWHGSSVMIAAAELGLVSIDDAMDRIIPERYGYAAHVLGSNAHASIATRLKKAVAVAVGAALPFAPPVVEQTVESDPSKPPLWSLAEPDEALGPEAFFKRTNESPEDFETRQRQRWEAFEHFQQALTKENARIIVENIGTDGVRIFVEAARPAAIELAQSILVMEEGRLRQMKNFALMLAECLSQDDPALARSMFERLEGRRAFVSLNYGQSAVSLEALSIWSSSDSPTMNALRRRRLEAAPTDYHIAQEVRAALMAGKNDLLEKYVEENLQMAEPAANARALMVLGFGAQSQKADEILARFANAGGFIGQAWKAACFAYDRDRWSRHWFEQMCNAKSGEEYWCLSTLFLKIVDGRYSGWEADIPRAGSIPSSFEPTIQFRMENRIKAWKSKREKTLCGDRAPGEVFVVIN